MPTPFGNLTAEEIKNGWTPETLAAYAASREQAAGFRDNSGVAEPLVAGNTVTTFVRPKPPIAMESAMGFRPHLWRR